MWISDPQMDDDTTLTFTPSLSGFGHFNRFHGSTPFRVHLLCLAN
jgi:hypothetical protein